MKVLTPLRRLLGVALFIAVPISKEWSSHVIRFLSSIWLIIPFYAFGGKTLAIHALIGALISIVFSACIYSAYEEALYAIEGLRDFFLASPLTSFEFRVGLALGIFLTTLPSVAVCLLMIFILTKCCIIKLLLVVFMTLILWITSVLIGYLVPVRMDVLATGNIIRILTIVFVVLPPIYYPLTVWPEPLRILAYAIPTFNISEIMKIILGVEQCTQQHLMTTIIAFIIEFLVITSLVYKRAKLG